MPRKPPANRPSEIRSLRLRLQLSQPQFATLLGVSPETYRTWDSGRRVVPAAWMDKARDLAAANDPRRLWSLQELATELGVHVRTLRNAARTGRLQVTYENQVVFGNPVPKSTMAAGRAFMARYYKQSYSRFAPKPRRPVRTSVPTDWVAQLLRIRRELRLTQGQLAEQIGAASKAVVYQWEARKRTPSPVLWQRVEAIVQARPDARRARILSKGGATHVSDRHATHTDEPHEVRSTPGGWYE